MATEQNFLNNPALQQLFTHYPNLRQQLKRIYHIAAREEGLLQGRIGSRKAHTGWVEGLNHIRAEMHRPGKDGEAMEAFRKFVAEFTL